MGKKTTEIVVEILERAGVKRCHDIASETLDLLAEAATRHSAPVVPDSLSSLLNKRRAPMSSPASFQIHVIAGLRFDNYHQTPGRMNCSIRSLRPGDRTADLDAPVGLMSVLPGNSRQPIQQPVSVAQSSLCR
jgi:hypothetical protein